MDQLKIQYNEYRRSKLQQRHREYPKKHMKKQREELGIILVKQDQNTRNKKCMDKKREELGIGLVKKDKNVRQKNLLIREELK